MEEQLATRGRELLRQLYQDHPDLRADRQARLVPGTDTHGVAHWRVEAGHGRRLATIFGEVKVRRCAHRAVGGRTCTPPTRR
ncbi:MAG: hypothetical protein ACOYBY_03540 [Dermatophilaceae bacterium]